ncbi:hypothetical protein [Nocardia sp. NRRL S-836]|uniref:hypothetical protein n=1 Tax=Nocardia sp. NRRL S-836 TaxID=1519492 RepID=UPI0012FCB9ED|nr:hypothetical protein [Nocardia sp. NRRL S-836]
MFDLIAHDDRVRHRALERHRQLVARSLDALHWSNRVWAQAGTPAPREPHLAAEMDRARADHRRHRDQTIFGYVDAFLETRGEAYWPFVVLYLRWEARHPEEWRSRDANLWSPWGRKEVVLGELGRRGMPDEMRPDAVDLIIDAVQRPYRCKDWKYALLVRHVAGTEFHARITALADGQDPVVQLRARFIIDLAKHPEVRITQKTWHRWLRDRQT